MLATLTGKAALATQFGFNHPIAAALRALEGADDVSSYFPLLWAFVLFF